MDLTLSPFCTIGPFFPACFVDGLEDLTEWDGNRAVGQHILLSGRVMEAGRTPEDAQGPTRNTILEIWQPDAKGIFRHPLDPRHADADPGFTGFGRARTGIDGAYRFKTVLPGGYPEGSVVRCPHINVMILAIGLTRRLVTTVFFADDPPSVSDPVLDCVADPAAKSRLFAVRDPAGDTANAIAYRFDVILRGANETPFFKD
jgi:protocatechuate 3,4-dioxygenase alpha subunit